MPAFLTQLGAVAVIPLITMPFRLMAPATSDVRRFGLLVGLIDIGAVISTHPRIRSEAVRWILGLVLRVCHP